MLLSQLALVIEEQTIELGHNANTLIILQECGVLGQISGIFGKEQAKQQSLTKQEGEVEIGQDEMGLINKPSPFKNASGRLGVGGHVFQFVVPASGISYGNDIVKKKIMLDQLK
jgi:hypothetical protein